MTDPRNRQYGRAVREYQRTHPNASLEQARKAVAARSGWQQSLPPRLPAAPSPRPAERLGGYVQRVAAAAGVHRHRAMEVLGLEPGTSATGRLDELAAGLPERTVRALCAATGMTPAQAHALTTPASAASRVPDLENLTRQVVDDKMIQPRGEGKTTTDAAALARLLAKSGGQRPLLMDMDPPRSLGWPGPSPYRPVVVAPPWPADGRPLPAAPNLVDEIQKKLGIAPNPQAE